MGRSNNRAVYFERLKHNTGTPGEFVEALKKSPYRQHRIVAVGLALQLKQMSADVITKLKEKEESQDFAKKIMS